MMFSHDAWTVIGAILAIVFTIILVMCVATSCVRTSPALVITLPHKKVIPTTTATDDAPSPDLDFEVFDLTNKTAPKVPLKFTQAHNLVDEFDGAENSASINSRYSLDFSDYHKPRAISGATITELPNPQSKTVNFDETGAITNNNVELYDDYAENIDTFDVGGAGNNKMEPDAATSSSPPPSPLPMAAPSSSSFRKTKKKYNLASLAKRLKKSSAFVATAPKNTTQLVNNSSADVSNTDNNNDDDDIDFTDIATDDNNTTTTATTQI